MMEKKLVIIKGPFSYSGNKYRIWNKHLKEVFGKFSKIHEPFLGSGVCLYNSNEGGMGLDTDVNVIQLHNSLKDFNLLDKLKTTYSQYFPNGRNKKSYLRLRSDFNKSFIEEGGTNSNNVHMLHLLIQLSFNSLLRFSRNGYNVPFGMKEIDLNRIRNHQDVIKNKNIIITHGNYSDLNLELVDKDNDIIYLDPPYIASKYQYGGWGSDDEKILLEYLDKISSDGYNFVLSNTTLHRGVVNQLLIDWCVKYNTKSLKMSYNSWSASVKGVKNEKDTLEVIISNFEF